MSSKTPFVFRKEDGKWRSRFNGRTFKFVEGLHTPGDPPPTTPCGAFQTLPKALRHERGPVKPDVSAPESSPVSAVANEPQPAPAIAPQAEQPLPVEPPAPEPQMPDSQPPAPEPSQSGQTEGPSGFPAYCADAIRHNDGHIEAGATGDDPAQSLLPGASQSAPTSNPAEALPLMEMAIDSMFQIGEKLGGPKAPKSATSGACSLEGLRDMMVTSAKQSFPGLDVEMGPRTTLAVCMLGYLGMCASHEQFRANTTPLWARAADRLRLGWAWVRIKLSRRKKGKTEDA